MAEMKKVTKEIKEVIIESRKKGLTLEGIGKILGISTATVHYHSSEENKQKVIDRVIKNKKPWKGQKEYNKKYQSERYNNDPEFREKVKEANKENWRKKHGKSNNIS